MGQLETGSRKRTRRANLKKIVLNTVAVAGVLSIGLVAPKVLGAMGKLGFLPTKRQKEFIRASRERLVRHGLLRYEGKLLRLTQKGEAVLRSLEFRDFVSKKPKRWDGKWRVLIFDIPERQRALRDKIRITLFKIGFVRLQNSVWLYPYDCEDLITFLKADFKVGKNLLYLVVDALEYDLPFKKKFNLPSDN
ncbi:MAG: hypothetical protein Q7S26_00455 [bacterium]|nr:hypothetical protein [bacterium]